VYDIIINIKKTDARSIGYSHPSCYSCYINKVAE